MSQSLLDIAYKFVSTKSEPVDFADLWKEVKAEANLSDEEATEKVSRFYTNLLMDGRFVTLGENKWDLRSRHTFDKVHIDMKDVYSEVDASDDDTEESSEEKEYNEAFNESNDTDEPFTEENEESEEL